MPFVRTPPPSETLIPQMRETVERTSSRLLRSCCPVGMNPYWWCLCLRLTGKQQMGFVPVPARARQCLAPADQRLDSTRLTRSADASLASRTGYLKLLAVRSLLAQALPIWCNYVLQLSDLCQALALGSEVSDLRLTYWSIPSNSRIFIQHRLRRSGTPAV